MPPREDAPLTRAALLARVDGLLREARTGHRNVSLSELEEVYTTGCAEILNLEAEVLRLRRRSDSALEAAGNGDATPPELADLAKSSRTVERTLKRLRADLRHVRTAIEWMQGQGDSAGSR